MLPALQEFTAIVEAVRKGATASKSGLATHTGSNKMREMMYCLGESAKRHGQRSLLKAESITLLRDARQNRLCARSDEMNVISQ